MARQDTIHVTGKIANLIFYTWKGRHFVRMAPAKVRQTKATKRSAADFGRAIRFSQTIRASFQPLIENHKDRDMMLRLNTEVFHWLRQSNPSTEISFVGFQFNPEKKLKLLLKCKMENGIVKVSTPSFNIPDGIRFPKNTELLQFRVVAISCHPDHFNTLKIKEQMIEIPFTEGEVSSKELELAFSPKSNTINIVAAGLHYFRKLQEEKLEEIKEWRSAAIIGGWIS